MKIIGIDDAGRGPVLGPMILSGVLAEKKDNDILKKWGAKDSKLLPPKKRKMLSKKIKRKYKYHFEITHPNEIDNSANLNYTEAIKAAKIINKLMGNIDEPVEIILDCPSVNLIAWNEDVFKLLKKTELITMKCEHKADFNHPIVSAASIVAKEMRETEVKKLKKEYGIDFGSGYPSDPKTQKFVKENYKNPKYKNLIRFSWDTVKKLEKEKEQKKLY
ncbi:MAG: ribonuclease HII [Candidatus Pacearchaeota archaeon]